METFESKEDRDFAVEMLREGGLTPEQEVNLMDRIDAFDQTPTQAAPADTMTPEELAHEQMMLDTFNRIDRTPTEAPPRQDRLRAGPIGFSAAELRGTVEAPTQENPDRQILMENAAAQGVDVTSGLDARTRAAAGLLAFDGQAQVAAVDAMLRKDLKNVPEDFPIVFNDSASGELTYLRQMEDGSLKPTLINPPGTDVGDIVEFAGEVPTFAMETAGSIGGAFAGSAAFGPGAGTVVGGTTGAAILAGLSVPVRQQVAKWLGVPQEIIDSVDTTSESLWQAGIAAGGELGSFAVLGTITGMRNYLGRPLDIKDLPAMQKKIDESLAKIRELEQRTGAKFNPTLGELSGDADLLVAEANLKTQAIGAAARELRVAGIESQKASVKALDGMATRKVRGPNDEGFRSVEDVSGSTRQRLVEDPIDDLTAARYDAEDALTDAQIVAAREADLDELTALRGDVFKQAEKIIEVETAAWEQYRRTVGWDPKAKQSGALLDNSGDTPIRQVMADLQKNGEEALLASLANAHRASLTNAGFDPRLIDKIVDPNDLTGLAQEALDPFHLHMALSHMKTELRNVQRGTSTNGWEATDIQSVISAIEQQMAGGSFVSRATGRALAPSRGARILDSWTHANDVTQNLHTVFDTKNMQSLMETQLVRTGERTVVEMPNLPAGLIRKRMLVPNDARMLSETMDVIGHEPRARTAMINEIRMLHADTVIKEGRFQQGAHNQFMDDYRDHMRVLGMEDSIDNVAQMGRAADLATKNLERMEATLGQFYGRTVADPTKPLNIAQEILSNRVKPGQAHNIIADLRKAGPGGEELADSVEEKILEEVMQSLTGNKGKIVNAAKLETTVRANRDTLTAVFGTQYVKDLDLLNDTLKIMGEGAFARSSKTALQAGWIAVTRSLFGPLSKKQRLLTSLQRVARNTRAGRVADILQDPDTLRAYVKLKNLSPRDPRYWITVQGLGILDDAMFNTEMEELYQRFSSGELASENAVEKKARELGLL